MKVLTFRDLRPEKGIPYSRQHIRRLVKKGKFPAPSKLGGGTNIWTDEQLNKHIKQLEAERDADTAAA